MVLRPIRKGVDEAGHGAIDTVPVLDCRTLDIRPVPLPADAYGTPGFCFTYATKSASEPTGSFALTTTMFGRLA